MKLASVQVVNVNRSDYRAYHPAAAAKGVEAQSDSVTREVLDAVVRAGEPLVIVSAPPGAGKTWLIETLAAVLVHYELRVGIVTPRVSQQDALLDRLLSNYPTLTPVQVLQSAQRDVPACSARYPERVNVTSDSRCLSQGPGVILSTAAKLLDSMPFIGADFDVLICDEAWQLSYHVMVPLLGAAKQVVLIGDPSQLSPLIRAKAPLTPLNVHLPAPDVLLQQHPQATHIRLPYSRRLTQGAVDLIQPAFYPILPFQSTNRPSERRLELFGISTGSAVDRAIDSLADGASIVSLVLPRRASACIGIDEELAQVEASVIRRLLDRRASWVGNKLLADADIGCVNSRVREGATVRKHLRNQGISTNNVWTDTGEVWQGQERCVILARHAASGLSALSAFELEIGRLCVALTRASLCTILTYRDGLEDTLRGHSHDCSARELGQEDSQYRGWSAHISLLDALKRSGRIIYM